MMPVNRQGKDAEGSAAGGGDIIGQGTALPLFLPQHGQANVVQQKGVALPAGGEEAGRKAHLDGMVPYHGGQHGAAFGLQLYGRILDAPDSPEQRPVKQRFQLFQRNVHQGNAGRHSGKIAFRREGSGVQRTGFPAFPHGADFLLAGVLLGFEGLPVLQAPLGHHRPGRCIRRMENVAVQRCQLHGRMQVRCGGSAHKKGCGESPGRHFAAQFLHLVQGRRNEAAYSYEGGVVLFGRVQDGLLVHHHAQIYHVKTVAAEHRAGNVLSNIVHVSMDGGANHHRALRALAIGLDMGFQNGHGVLHELGALDHLR